MRFSEAWLRESVNPAIDTASLVEQLTMAGLEVDSVDAAAADFQGVVVGEVISIRPHPNADRLKVCEVAVGAGEPLQIVCGASNVQEGMRVPTAQVNALLPGDFKIKKSKLRGELSLGMLCSAKELGLAEESEGLLALPADAPVGVDVRQYLGLDDVCIEVDLTPNRADCLSLEGIAREVAVLNQLLWEPPAILAANVDHEAEQAVTVTASEACPRYLGRLIKGLDRSRETPLWMQERLRRSGLRSLGPLVDVTNYVLLELGQPLHAFDADKIEGAIEVRFGREGDRLVLLNGQEIEIGEDVLVIADDVKVLALAGVMGGAESAVGEDTRDIFLECAFFMPTAIMGKARAFGLHTDSSHRFERGVDFALQQRAIERATELLTAIAGGSVGPLIERQAPEFLPKREAILLRAARIHSLLGVELAAETVGRILSSLGMALTSHDQGWWVTPPSFRFDISIEADLIEELARIHGYDNLPRSSLKTRSALVPDPESVLALDRLKCLLVDRGFQEAITYSFVDPALQQQLHPDLAAIALKNPLSTDLSVMRVSLWPGLITAAQRNYQRQRARVRLFETGLRFWRTEDDSIRQEKTLAGLVMGSVSEAQWGEKPRAVDFFDLKADVEAVLGLSRLSAKFVAAKHPALHPGQNARIVAADDTPLGWIGMLHPELERSLEFDAPVFLFELDQRILNREIPAFMPLSKFPSVRRDLALIVDEEVAAGTLLDCVLGLGNEVLRELSIFDVYRGEGIEAGRKSIAMSLTLQDSSKTLTDSEIDAIVMDVLQKLAADLNVKLRD